MRFRFCRDCDCPDWLLAEILTLSKINPATLKELSSIVAKSICEENLPYEYLLKLLSNDGFDESAIQASIASLRWILSNAAGSFTDAHTLNSELQQLGLPRDRSEAVQETFQEQRNDLIATLQDQTLKASGKVGFSYDIKGIQVGEEKEPVLQLNIEGKVLDQQKGFRAVTANAEHEEKEVESVFMSHEQLGALIHELEDAYKHMNDLRP